MAKVLDSKGVLLTRGLSRALAAQYVGISTTKFDEMVRHGEMPKPKIIGRRKVWDRFDIDAAFGELPEEASECEWDEVFKS